MSGLIHRCLATVLCLSLLAPQAYPESPHPFVPESFAAPTRLAGEGFVLRPLTVSDVVKDYDAVMSSADHLKTVWPGSEWPDGLTLEQNLIELGWHQREFQRSRSFAYTVVAPDESRVLGCVYIYPTRKAGFDAEVYLWTRPPEQNPGVDEDTLRKVVRAWLKDEWPFKAAAFPGTDISWSEWTALPELKR